MTKLTLLSHIYNEEYLLPFWLNHHKDIVDHGIIFDYNSTDKSVEICKQICPTWEVITSRNKYFEAAEVDKEVMDKEASIDGIKIVLNTTELLFSERPIKDIFEAYGTQPVSLSIQVVTPYSLREYTPRNMYDLLDGLLDNDTLYNNTRGGRYIHTYPSGNYVVGRHNTHNPNSITNDIHIVWLGYYPLNEYLLERKLQIHNNIPESDRVAGRGFHHFIEKEEMLANNVILYKTASNLTLVNPRLHILLNTIVRSTRNALCNLE